MTVNRCSPCPCFSCTEHCDDYLQLLQKLIEAEAVIEKLRYDIACLQQDKDFTE